MTWGAKGRKKQAKPKKTVKKKSVMSKFKAGY